MNTLRLLLLIALLAGALVLMISTQMLEVDYGDSFTDAFSLANKAADFLMYKDGREVCDCDGRPEHFAAFEERVLVRI